MKQLIYILAILVGLISLACEEEDYYQNTDATLVFSLDTLAFDTVFTKMGSVTRHFKVFNRFYKDLKINHITLSGGDASMFRVNVDGIAANSISDMVIRKLDSMYVFVEVTVDPTNNNLPFVVSDSIIFETNGNIQDVDLTAYGQNVHHVEISKTDSVVFLDNAKTIKALYWADKRLAADKPYLIHDHIYIDSLSTLTIDEGVTLYMRKDVNIYVQGSLVVNGSLDLPVVIRGDRLDEIYSGTSYDKVPGQWGYIYLMPGSRNNRVTYAEIRNGNIGIQVDSAVVDEVPTLKISHSKIAYMSTVGLYAVAATVEADNCLFANCDQYGVALINGGDYLFNHCTLAGYRSWGSRRTPFLTISNYLYNNPEVIRDVKRAEFNNCIVYGLNNNEVDINIKNDSIHSTNSYLFNHCLLRVGRDLDTTNVESFRNTIWNKDPKLITSNNALNFALDTLSPAISMADTLISKQYEFDLNGKPRLLDGLPDIGAYEYVPVKDEE